MVAMDETRGSRTALRWTIGHVASEGEDTVLLLCVQDPSVQPVAVTPQVLDGLMERSRQMCQETDKQVQCEGVFVEGDVREKIVSICADRDVDLLVLGSRRQLSSHRMLTGSRGNYCAVCAPCPVLVVRMAPEEEQLRLQCNRPRRIAVGLDRSEASGEACKWVLHHVCRAEDRLYLLHADREPSYAMQDRMLAADGKKANDSMMRPHFDALISLALQTKGAAFEVSTHVLEGDPRPLLVDFCERNHIDLLVVATRGTGSVRGVVLGNVSAYMVQYCPCTLLLYRQKEADVSLILLAPWLAYFHFRFCCDQAFSLSLYCVSNYGS
ncbi:hypothetical protein CLOP_g6254 [Closterium sp. NIES-67]|nr:hypothetical protein CLOP_g6254 [Closterium sp. NIES-67]